LYIQQSRKRLKKSIFQSERKTLEFFIITTAQNINSTLTQKLLNFYFSCFEGFENIALPSIRTQLPCLFDSLDDNCIQTFSTYEHLQGLRECA